MPALKGAEIMRAYSVDFDVLPPWLQRLVASDRAAALRQKGTRP